MLTSVASLNSRPGWTWQANNQWSEHTVRLSSGCKAVLTLITSMNSVSCEATHQLNDTKLANLVYFESRHRHTTLHCRE